MIHHCSNGRPLIITNKNALESELNNTCMPCVVLLTAWDKKTASIDFWDSSIRYLLDKNTTYFLCVGPFSEKLHDEIDELVLQYDEFNVEQSMNIVTTYHEEESVEDIVAFFVYGTEMRNKNNGCLVAIIENDHLKNEELRRLLKEA